MLELVAERLPLFTWSAPINSNKAHLLQNGTSTGHLKPPSPHPTLPSPHPYGQPTLLSSAVPKWLMRLRWWPNTIIFCPPSSLSMTYSLHDGGHTYHLKYTRAHPIPPHPCSDILDGRELEIGCPLVQ